MFKNKLKKIAALSLLMGSLVISAQAMETRDFQLSADQDKCYLNDFDMFESMVDVALEVLCFVRIDHLLLFRKIINGTLNGALGYCCPQCGRQIEEFDVQGNYRVGYCPGSSGLSLSDQLSYLDEFYIERCNTTPNTYVYTDKNNIFNVEHELPLNFDFEFLKYICNNTQECIDDIEKRCASCTDGIKKRKLNILKQKILTITSILGSENEEGLFEKIGNFKTSNAKDSSVLSIGPFMYYFISVNCKLFDYEGKDKETLKYNIDFMKNLIKSEKFKKHLENCKQHYSKFGLDSKNKFDTEMREEIKELELEGKDLKKYV